MPVFSLLFALSALSALRSCEGAANDGLRALPCPDPADIFPCVCTTGSENHMTMDCSDLASEDELARVFSSNLPFTKFHLLKIEENQNLRVLREGDLGPASFSVIIINGGVLEEVQYGAFAGSYSTAEVIDLSRNALTEFPFYELPLFTSLSTVAVDNNVISSIPVLQSASLKDLNFGNNIDTIFPETFANLPLLNYVILFDNNLSNVPKGAIAFSSTDNGYVDLRSNIIGSIEVDAITGLNAGTLYLNGNSLSVLEEDVFRPILEGGATVYLNENPLQCGCDVAWLVLNPALLALTPEATCNDGEALEDLDPSIFEDLC
ncbi:oplophorus-luciferin 2-monooxygenase non-catalytic subunit-like [Penaeus chinensis]|uniref:oplophorus-luciferin 2-monooxygenase non-catalytic subunit-like n=1 Tax=Penaeus chinensis TaxID=139456 RepID=UPI001FB5FF1A|nr:oplophorus-luciferin 2-monooxygenase non-catalytic subunit-like [Penaeus chinensis]